MVKSCFTDRKSNPANKRGSRQHNYHKLKINLCDIREKFAENGKFKFVGVTLGKNPE